MKPLNSLQFDTGFTLVEILILIAVFGLVVSISAPRFQQMKSADSSRSIQPGN